MLHSVSDPALAESSDLDAYVRTLDSAHLVPRPGMDLAAFEVHALSKARTDAVLNDCGSPDDAGVLVSRWGVAFYAACVRAVHGMVLVQDDGTEAVGTISGARVLDVPREIRIEIGLYARRLCSEVPEGFFGPPRDSSAAGTDT